MPLLVLPPRAKLQAISPFKANEKRLFFQGSATWVLGWEFWGRRLVEKQARDYNSVRPVRQQR